MVEQRLRVCIGRARAMAETKSEAAVEIVLTRWGSPLSTLFLSLPALLVCRRDAVRYD